MGKKLQVTTAPWDITVVTTAPPARGSYRRKPAAASVANSGHASLNQEATDLMREVIRKAGYTDARYAIQAGVNVEAEVIVLYAVDPGSPGSVVPRLTHRDRCMSIDLGGVFIEYQSLRSPNTRHCPINIATDKQNTICLVVTLKGTYTTSPRTRRSRTGAKAVDTE
ncbi:MAG: hypothetical protein ACM3XM_06110 [Mycobacterium leprae]